jgi:hypothetical protein
MATVQLVLGCLLLGGGAVLILGRHRIAARHRNLGAWQTGAPVLWAFIGALLAINGVVQLVLAVAA